MHFELFPCLDLMTGLYRQPRTPERFRNYLYLLQADRPGDLLLPVGFYNPMAKEHLLDKLAELKALDAEGITARALAHLNRELAGVQPGTVIRTALNVADDRMGGWTNRFTTDYDSRFRINALVQRRFCTPVLWSSEHYSERVVRLRVLEYGWRTVSGLLHGKPRTLEDHLRQEVYVAGKGERDGPGFPSDPSFLRTFVEAHRLTTEYSLIFNFFYGDDASASLGYPVFGIKGERPGFAYARMLADSDGNP